MKTQTNNPKILCDIISQKAMNGSKDEILHQLSQVDEQLVKLYGGNTLSNSLSHEFSATTYSPKTMLNSTLNMTMSLGIPKSNSLTDSLLRSTLGCEQKLAKSYMQIMKESELSDEEERERKKEVAKKKFSQSNPYSSSQANSKPLMDNTSKAYLRKKKPVIDNEHDSFMKTQLIYMQKMKNGYKIEDKDFYDKHMDKTTKKINQIGGIEDTVSHMQESLRRNQMKNVQNRSYLSGTHNTQQQHSIPLTSRSKQKEKKNSWIDRSKATREAMMASMSIN